MAGHVTIYDMDSTALSKQVGAGLVDLKLNDGRVYRGDVVAVNSRSTSIRCWKVWQWSTVRLTNDSIVSASKVRS